MTNESDPTAIAVRGLWRVLRTQWWVVLMCLVVGAGSAVGYTKLVHPRYQAERSLDLPMLLGTVGTSGAVDASGSSAIGSGATQLLTSSTTLQAVARAAHVGPGSITLAGSENSSATVLTITATAPGASEAVAAANQAVVSVVSGERRATTALADAAFRQTQLVSKEISSVQSLIAAATSSGQVTSLKTQLAVDQAQYLQLYRTYSSYELAAATISPGPAVVKPSGTVSISTSRTLLIALVIALVIGFALALVRDHLSDGIQERDEVGDAQLPLLAEVPSVGRPRPPAQVVVDSTSPFAESIRELRTSIRFLRTERPLRVLMVTSPSAGEGKSFVAAHLAAATAAAGSSTVLLSTDLRRPTIEGYFALVGTDQSLSGMLVEASGRGLLRFDRHVQEVDALPSNGHHSEGDVGIPGPLRADRAERVDLSRLLATTELPYLKVIPTGPPPPNPAELLGSWAMGDLMDQLRDSADVVVVDSPPTLGVTDTLVVSAHADGVILVVSRNRTSRPAIDEALQRLRRGPAPVLGSVLNRGRHGVGNYLYLAPSGASKGSAGERS